MAVEIEIDIVCPVTDNELYNLRDMLKREAPQLSQVQLKTKPIQPGEMGDGLLDNIITATVSGAISVALEQFYVQVWEPMIAPLIARWLKIKDLSGIKESGGQNKQTIIEVSLNDGATRHSFAVDIYGKRYTTDLLSYTINPQKTYVVLIGCSEYDDGLPGIPPIKTNLENLQTVFTSTTGMAIPPSHVVKLLNTDHKTIKRKLYEISHKDEMDTLLIYFAGHGYRAGAKDLFLLVKDSCKLNDAEYLQAIEYGFIKKILKEAAAKQKILILDACHSGLATLSVTHQQMDAEGAYILASSQGHEVSYYDPSHPHTYFTGALLEVLQKGVEPYKEKISLDDVYEKTKKLLTEKGFPQPVRCQKLNIHSSHYFLCSNPAFSIAILRDAVRQIKAAGRHEDALYELELLMKRFPKDIELRDMQRTYSPDTLFAKLIEEANELFYKKALYEEALKKYTRALSLRYDSPEVREKIRQCEEAIQAKALPLGGSEQHGIQVVVKNEQALQPVNKELSAKTSANTRIGFKRAWTIFLFAATAITVTVMILDKALHYFLDAPEIMFRYTLQIQWQDTTGPVFGNVGIRQFDNKLAGDRTDSAMISGNDKVVFQFPLHLRKNSGRIVLLGDLGQEFEIMPEQQRITLIDYYTQKVNVRRKKVSAVISQQPEKKRVVTTETPIKQETTKAQIPEELNGAVFDSLASSNSLRIYEIQKNTCSIEGRLCGYQVTAKLSFDGRTFRTISGDVQGSFSLYDNNTRITGSLMVRSSKMPCPITFTRR